MPLFIKRLGSLYPAPGDEQSEALMRSIGQGKIVEVTIKRPRNVQFHRKLFAMLKIIKDNQDYYKTTEEILTIAKLAIGHTYTIDSHRFGRVTLPDSISFAAMDEPAFQEFYDRVVAWVASDVVPGLRRKDLDEAVEAELLGFGEGP